MFYFKLKDETEYPVVETGLLDNLKIIEDDKARLIEYMDSLTDDNLSKCELLDRNKNHIEYFENLHYSGTFTILQDGGLTIGKYSLVKLSDSEIKIRDLSVKLSEIESAYDALNNAFIEFALNSDTVLIDEQDDDNEIIDNEVPDDGNDDPVEVPDDGGINEEEGIGNE